MRRSVQSYINQWYKLKNRKPLVIRGARQVGKTTLVRMCAEQLGLQLIEINLEKPFLFTQSLASSNPVKIIELIEFELNVDIQTNSCLLFFDEVQAVPEILPLLRYFYEETPEYAVVVTGSLLEFVLDEPEFSMPVGRVSFLHMGPMLFEEFLMAMGEHRLLDFLAHYQLAQDIPDVIHQRLAHYVKTYCIVGGMPEVVSEYAKNKSLKKISLIKNDIVTAFQLDFGKYRKKTNSKLLSKVFYRLPHLIGQKLKYTQLDSGVRAKDLNTIIEQLCLAKLAYRVYHTHCNGVPLKGELVEKIFKMLFLDVGLAQSILGVNPLDYESKSDLNQINKGAVAEQFIGQHLLFFQDESQPPELFYWVREKKSSSAEVDYVISQNNRIYPVEVKSGKTGTLRSLQLFVQEKSTPTAIRFNANTPSVLHEVRKTARGEVNYTLISLPHYLVEQLNRLTGR